MNILLVLPAAEHVRIRHAGMRVPRRAMFRFSVLPLTQVAALTPEGHTVEICDENVTPVDFDHPADLVGLSFMTALAPRAYEIAREFRRRGKRVVAGGYHPTLAPDDAAPHVDAVVVGDAEGLWPQVVRDAEHGVLQRVYRHSAPPDLAHTPAPRRELLQRTARHYATTGAVQVGRGCPHGCRYCSVTAFHGRTYRARPLEEVLCELRGMGRRLLFVDDNIIADRAYAARLFRALVPLKKTWVSQCSIEIADDPELLGLARRAGCRGLFIGLETASAENLAGLGKGFNAAAAYAPRIAAIRRSGIAVIAGIIVGLDGDDQRVFAETLAFLREVGVDALQLNILTPLPGTPLYDEWKAAGRIVDDDWSHYDFRHVVIRPARMTARDLQNGADWLYRQFYRPDRILARVCRTAATAGWQPAWIAWRLNLAYRYDIIRERIRGSDPARAAGRTRLLSKPYRVTGVSPVKRAFLFGRSVSMGRVAATLALVFGLMLLCALLLLVLPGRAAGLIGHLRVLLSAAAFAAGAAWLALSLLAVPRAVLYLLRLRRPARSFRTVAAGSAALVLACFPLALAGIGAMMIGMTDLETSAALPPLSAAQRAAAGALEADVRLLAGDIGVRHAAARYEGLRAAADAIERAFDAAGYPVRRRAYAIGWLNDRPCYNLEVEIRGSVHPDEIVLVGAHYDSAEGTPGANDNASGVAVLLALARALAGAAPERTLRLVAFANEEPPFFWSRDMGSLVYARACRARQERIVAMLCLETLGYYTDAEGSQRYPLPVFRWVYPDTGHFVAVIGNLASCRLARRAVGTFRRSGAMPVQAAILPGWITGAGWSDHWAFWKTGYPAVMITDTALFRYPWYHTLGDTPEKLDYERMARVTEGIQAVVADLAGIP